MIILPAFSSATISSVEARVFFIALYFKLRRGSRAASLDSLKYSLISVVSDKWRPSRTFFYHLAPGKIPYVPIEPRKPRILK